MDLNRGSESKFLSCGGTEFQSRGPDQLKVLLPMVERWAEGTDGWMEADDLREGVATRMSQVWRGEVMDGLEC